MSKKHDIVVIGSGPGGYIAALHAAQKGANVAVVEMGHLGGTCLNVGCIPSKALLAPAQLLHAIRTGGALGVTVDGEPRFDWKKIQKHLTKTVRTLRGGVGMLFKSRGVTLYEGRGRLAGGGTVAVETEDGTQEITAGKIILATGSVPVRIPGWPDDPNLVCTSQEALFWDAPPQRLLIVGGGVIGCEFACMMNAYGVAVTVVEMLPRLMPVLEDQLGDAMGDIFAKRDITCLTGTKVERMTARDGGIAADLSNGQTVEADKCLVAVGRKPNTADLGLETVGIETDRGVIPVNDRMETSADGVYCIGDANGRWQLAHAASAQGIVAAENALGGDRLDDKPVPTGEYTFPEIASVGLTTTEARQQGLAISVGTFPLRNLGKAKAVAHDEGFCKVLRARDDGRLVGVHVLGHNATEVIHAAAALIGTRASAEDLANMTIAHPTISECLKEAAEDSFSRALHSPPRETLTATVGGED
ncbi:MAG: dihydrolipoyl dehydrogenase [Phycisphaerae bacterium]|nr:dihydrolipoyl dehydrogenase [Phycisphaerae bacterium]